MPEERWTGAIWPELMNCEAGGEAGSQKSKPGMPFASSMLDYEKSVELVRRHRSPNLVRARRRSAALPPLTSD